MFWLLIIICGLADYGRGRGYKGIPFFKQICILINGYCLAVITGHYFDLQVLFIVGLFWLFISVGYGQPWGAAIHGRSPSEQLRLERLRKDKANTPKYEGWQLFKFSRENAYLALMLRGALSLPFLIIGAYQIVIAYIIAFPLAAFIGYQISEYQNIENHRWKYSEALRGLIGAIIAGSV